TRSKRDWSSDVCSSDLTGCEFEDFAALLLRVNGTLHACHGDSLGKNWGGVEKEGGASAALVLAEELARLLGFHLSDNGVALEAKIGRASCREGAQVAGG